METNRQAELHEQMWLVLDSRLASVGRKLTKLSCLGHNMLRKCSAKNTKRIVKLKSSKVLPNDIAINM